MTTYTNKAKDLLLEDYRYRAEMMRESEKAGETRVNLFLVLMALVSGALVQFAASDNRLDARTVYLVVGGGLGALLMFGWLTLLRLIKRNKSTDECKHSMDLIRQIFKDRFDEDGILLGYYPVNWPKHEPEKKGWFNLPRWLKWTKDLRSFGGLAHLVASINGILVAGLCAAIMWHAGLSILGNVLAASALAFVASLLGQVWYVSSKERKHRDEVKQLLPTHAGGVVVKQVGGQNHYLLVRPQKNNDQWVLPKGHIEPGEGHGEGALREVKEETGVTARLLSPLGQWDFAVQEKSVRMKVYLMAYEEDGAKRDNREVHWSDAKAAITAATHPETKEILKKAERVIEMIRTQEPTTITKGND